MKPPNKPVARRPDCQRDPPLSGKSHSCAPAVPARPHSTLLYPKDLATNSRLAIRMPSPRQRRCKAKSLLMEVVMTKARLMFVFLVLVPAFALAQSAQDSWDTLKQLQPGQTIQVVDSSMKSFKGEFVSVSDVGISLRAGKKNEQSVPRAEVVRVSVSDTSHRTRNMLIGMGFGAGGGLAAGYGIDEGVRHVSCEGGSYVYMPVLAAAGGGLGALAGGLPAGWRTIYRVKK